MSLACVCETTWWLLPQTGLWYLRRVQAAIGGSGWSPIWQVCSIHRWSSAGRREWWGKSPAQTRGAGSMLQVWSRFSNTVKSMQTRLHSHITAKVCTAKNNRALYNSDMYRASRSTAHDYIKTRLQRLSEDWELICSRCFSAVRVSYQTEGKVEQSRAAVEQDRYERGGGGEEEANVSAHHHPQRLQDLQSNKASVNM